MTAEWLFIYEISCLLSQKRKFPDFQKNGHPDIEHVPIFLTSEKNPFDKVKSRFTTRFLSVIDSLKNASNGSIVFRKALKALIYSILIKRFVEYIF